MPHASSMTLDARAAQGRAARLAGGRSPGLDAAAAVVKPGKAWVISGQCKPWRDCRRKFTFGLR